MEFHQTQEIVAKSKARFRVVDCGRQWGKTTLAVWEMLACAYSKKDRRVRYYATTFDQARDIAWSLLKQISNPVWAKEPNESRLELTIKTQDGGTSQISLEGWESVERARGQQFDFLVLDEVSKMRNFKEGWEGALLGTLIFRNGTALFISTPAGFNHFHDLYQNGQKGLEGWASWRFTSFDNPFLSKDYLEGIHNDVTEDYWAQEYLADFRRFTGLIYKEFDLSNHVHYFDTPYKQHGDYYLGLDFAVRGYTACIAGVVKSDGHVYLMDEYKRSSDTAVNHAENIKSKLEKYNTLDSFNGYADPAGFAKNQQKGDMLWSIADEYLESGFGIVPANNEVMAGINYVRQLMRANKIHIHPRCEELVKEILQYQWKDQPEKQTGQLEEPEKVRKVNDHLCDAMRYMCYSKPSPAEEEEKPRPLVFPAQFPLRVEEEKEEFKYEEVDFPSVYD